MMKFTIYDPDSAVREASRYMTRDHGFAFSHRGLNSIYMVKLKAGKVIAKGRISTHASTIGDSDLAFNLVFNYPTILNDIQTRVQSVARKFG